MGDAQRPREPVSSDPLLLTPEEAAEVLRVGRTTVYALMKAGELHAVHIGRSCRLSSAPYLTSIGSCGCAGRWPCR